MAPEVVTPPAAPAARVLTAAAGTAPARTGAVNSYACSSLSLIKPWIWCGSAPMSGARGTRSRIPPGIGSEDWSAALLIWSESYG